MTALGADGDRLDLSNQSVGERERLLEQLDVNLDKAREYYDKLGGDKGAQRANGVATSFSGLSSNELSCLENHAAWQTHACAVVYRFVDSLDADP